MQQELSRAQLQKEFGDRYKFTAADNDIAGAEMTVARLLDAGQGVMSDQVKLVVSALGRKLGGDFEMSVTTYSDGSHGVVIERK